MNFNNLPKDIIKLIFLDVLKDESIQKINNMKFLCKQAWIAINDSPCLYYGKYAQLWHGHVINGTGIRRAYLYSDVLSESLSIYEIKLITPRIVRYMDERCH